MAGAPLIARASDALRALREKFRLTSGALIATFDALSNELAADSGSTDTLAALRKELHRVHGTAGSYGFLEASRLAEKLELRTEQWELDPDLERDQRATIIGHFASALRLSLNADPTIGQISAVRRRMLLVDVAAPYVRTVRSGGATRGYHLTVWPATDLTASALREQAPHVLVVPGAAGASVLDAAAAANVPVIALLASDAKPDTALEARWAGVTAHPETAEISALFDLADRLSLGSSWVGATVLVLDDDPSILAIVQYLLEAEGVRVRTCDDPHDLHHQLAAVAPSLLLLDERLGDASGIALARELRTLPSYRDLPIIIVSADSSEKTQAAAHAVGADDFLPKPIVATELRERISKQLERRRMQRLEEGRHPGTGLSLPPRTLVEVSAFLDRARNADRVVSLALVRPDSTDLAGDHAGDWLHESQRLANAVAGSESVVGYCDGVALLIAMEGEAELAESLFDALARGRAPTTPRWRCGVADVSELPLELGALRRAAEEAIDLSPPDANGCVTRWRRADARRPPDVILIEDDAALSEMIQHVLRLSSFTCRAFARGAPALQALLEFETTGGRPLVLLDVDLPDLDGHTLHDRLCAERPGDYAVVFITGHTTDGDQVRALQAGALDYVAKPVSYRVLMSKVTVWRDRAAVRGPSGTPDA
jgi:DNA-binding response OmpR family regulator